MESVLIILGVLLFAGLAIAGVVYGAKKARERREALEALARGYGWSFRPDSDSSMESRLPGYDCFRTGHSRRGYNTMEGTLSIDGKAFALIAGDYTYKITTSNGKTTTTHTHNFSYLVLKAPFAGLPTLLIRREGFFDKIAGAIGFDDIDFESAEFSRKFFVKSSDRKFAFAVVHPRMIEFLLSCDPPPIDLRDGWLCLNGPGTWPAQDFASRVRFLEKFFDLWPDYLRADLDSRTRSVAS